MENAQSPERPKNTGKERSVGLEIHGSKTKIDDITGQSLLSKEGREKVIQADGEPEETTGVKVSKVLERLKLNSEIGSENPQTTLESTNDNLRPEFKQLETDKKQEVASEGWIKKAWGKVAFSSPDNLYFKPNIIEKWGNGRIYELLETKHYTRFMDWAFPKRAIPYSTFALGTKDRKSALQKVEKYTRVLESIYVSMIPCFGLLSATSLFYFGSPAFAHIVDAANFVVNFYPTIELRYDRIRLYNLIDQLNARERKNNNK